MTKFQSIESLVLRALRIGCHVEFAPGYSFSNDSIEITVSFRNHHCGRMINLSSANHSADFLLSEMERMVEKVLKEPFPEDERLLREFEERGADHDS